MNEDLKKELERLNSGIEVLGKVAQVKAAQSAPLPGTGDDGRERAIAMSEPGTIVTGKSQLRRVAAEPQIFRTDARGNAQVAVSEPCPIEVQMNCRSF